MTSLIGERKRLEHVSDLIGDYGRYQRYNSLVHCAATAILPFLVFSLSFYAPPVQHFCADDLTTLYNEVSPLIPKISLGSLINLALIDTDKDTRGLRVYQMAIWEQHGCDHHLRMGLGLRSGVALISDSVRIHDWHVLLISHCFTAQRQIRSKANLLDWFDSWDHRCNWLRWGAVHHPVHCGPILGWVCGDNSIQRWYSHV